MAMEPKMEFEVLRRGVEFALDHLYENDADLIRYGIPLIIDYFVTNNSIIEFFDSKIFYSDIYYFVGLYFIFLSILKKYKISDYSIFLITILTISINTLLFEHLKDLPIISKIFLGHFAYIDQDSCFPLLTWAIFPTIGLLIGNKMKKCENHVFSPAYPEKDMNEITAMFSELPQIDDELLPDEKEKMILRTDEADSVKYTRGELLANAPVAESGCFVVPKTV